MSLSKPFTLFETTGSYAIKCLMVLLTLILSTQPAMCQTDGPAIADQLTASYQLPTVFDNDQAAPIIQSLQSSLATCDDPLLAARIEYRIGVLHVKSEQFKTARPWFNRPLARSQCPLLIRAAARNMLAQLDRLEGRDLSALENFGHLIDLLDKNYSENDMEQLPPTMAQLWVSAHLARAEMFQQQQNNESAVQEYQRLIALLSQPSFKLPDSLLLPKVMDRCAGAYFQAGRLDAYLDLTDQMSQRFEKYPRLPLVRFEAACVRFCQTNTLSMDYAKGLAVLPVRVITAIKTKEHHADLTDLLQTLDQLIERYSHNPWSSLLLYHQGWLLDAQGKNREAANVFARLQTMPLSETRHTPEVQRMLTTLKSYGQLFHALLLSEASHYVQAVKILDELPAFDRQSHQAQITDALTKNIKILKRELRNQENAHD